MRRMGRRRTTNKHLPLRVYHSRGWYFYATPEGPWIKLGKTETAMYAALARLVAADSQRGMLKLIADYEATELPKKAESTQLEYKRILINLRRTFGHMTPDQVTPKAAADMHDAIGKESPVYANRHLAVLSGVMRYGVRKGYNATNPCRDLKRHGEKPRGREVQHWEFWAVWKLAGRRMQFLMALAYLTGQRKGDILKARDSQVKNGEVSFAQSKTGKKLDVEMSHALAEILRQIRAWRAEQRKKHENVIVPMDPHLLSDGRGQPWKASAQNPAWQRLMRRALKETQLERSFTFHDIRSKAADDAKDSKLLGNDPRTLNRVYRRKAVRVEPTA